jgi:7,8-dihydro-6-hydroxymethylpterin-pyrophosphokinase
VLAPLAELAPDWRLSDGRSVVQALASLSKQRIKRISV